MESFSIEALDFEQKKQEALLEAAHERKMEAGEVQEFLSGVEKEIEALKTALLEQKAELKKTKNGAAKEEIQSIIDELEVQISGLSEIDKEDEFRVRTIAQF